MPFMLPRDLDVDAHNAKVRAWREEEAKRAAKLRESKTNGAKADSATDCRPRAIGDDGPTLPEAARTQRVAPPHAPGTAAIPLANSAPSFRRAAVAGAPIYPLVGLCRAAGLPEPIPEFKFHPQRKWRADYCWPIHKVIVEIEGGLFVQGRHSRGAGQLGDMEKYNAAGLLGFIVLRYSPQQLGNAIRDLRIMFAREAA